MRKIISGLSIASILILAAVFLTTPRERSLVVNTLILSAAVVAISVPFGTLLGLSVARTNLPGRKLFYLWIATLL